MFDNISKFLAEQFSTDFASWLIGESIALTELSPSELSLEPIRADALILLESDRMVLHCEFQTDPDPTMPFRMADYRLRVYRRFPQKQMVQVVIYLRQSSSELVYQTRFELETMQHSFRVIRLWEQDPEVLLQYPGLLPYLALSQTSDREAALRRAVQEIGRVENRRQQNNLITATGILASLILEKDVISRILRREQMKDSVIYQEILQEGREEGREKGREEGREEARRSTAIKLLQQGMEIETIALVTELSIAEIQLLPTNP